MGWGRIDDEFDEHPKVLALLDENDEADAAAALAIWSLCFPYAHRNSRKRGRTPGFIPAGLPRRYLGSLGRRGAEILVKHRLWDITDNGWVFHDFAEYLPSEKVREERAAAGRKGAAARWHGKGKPEATPSQPDGKLPSDDGSLPSGDGKPMANDGNAEANDGSHAPARRDPIPVPVTHTQTRKSKAEDQTLFPAADASGEKLPGTDLVVVDEKPAPKAKRGTRLDPNWLPSTEDREWALAELPGFDTRREHPRFVDYWVAKSGKDATKLDWGRTWRNWMRTAADRSGWKPNRLAALPDGRNVHRKTTDHLSHMAAYGGPTDA